MDETTIEVSSSSLLLDCISYSLSFKNPIYWMRMIKLKCGEYNLSGNNEDQVIHGFCDILQPASNSVE